MHSHSRDRDRGAQPGRTPTGLRRATLAVLCLLALLATDASSALAARHVRHAPRRGPAGLRFYIPPRRLPARHGTLIWQRPLRGPAALPGATNTLLLYTQVGVRGRPVAVSGVLSVPRGRPPRGGWPVITYDHGTTGIADPCAPSRDSVNSSVHGYIAYIYPLLNRWLRAGYAVARTDYEGLGGPGVHPYLIGTSEGRGTLDIVRAARQLAPRLSARVLIAGHSQGGHAALWAAALANSYTPDLRVLGTVAFAPASHTAQEASFLKSLKSTALTALASMITRGVDVASPGLRVRSQLTTRAATLYPQTLTRCLPDLGKPDSFGGLPLNQLFKPSTDLGPFIAVLAANDPGHLRIRGPVLIEQGLGDQTVFPAFTSDLVAQLRKLGNRITYHTYPGVTHSGVVVSAASDATAFFRARLR